MEPASRLGAEDRYKDVSRPKAFTVIILCYPPDEQNENLDDFFLPAYSSVLHIEDTASAVFVPDWLGQKITTDNSLVKIGFLNGPT